MCQKMGKPLSSNALLSSSWLIISFPQKKRPGGMNTYIFIQGSLEVKLPTVWTDEKQSREEAKRRERLEERRSEEKESEERRCRCEKR